MPNRSRSMHRAVNRLMPELDRMAVSQQNKILSRLVRADSVRETTTMADLLIRRRHARRKARLIQKASRKRNRS